MSEFWEDNFVEKQSMWGFEPSNSTLITRDFFVEKAVKNILIPGIGYGRNAQIFRESGIEVTGIEISGTAIALAHKYYGRDMPIFHGSVTDMPFDNNKYDGIFCYALIHLLDDKARIKLIEDCYRQLQKGGYMFFIAINKDAPNFGNGKEVGKDRYEIHKGAPIFYYDESSVKAEFSKFGLYAIESVNENQPMYLIRCKKI